MTLLKMLEAFVGLWLGRVRRTGQMTQYSPCPFFLIVVYSVASHPQLAFCSFSLYLHSQLPHLYFPPQVVQDLGCLVFQVSFSDSFYLYHPRQVAVFKSMPDVEYADGKLWPWLYNLALNVRK